MIGWLERLFGGGDGAQERALYGEPVELAAVEAVIAAQRAYFHADGGEVELRGVRDGWVEVRLSGSCAGCAGQEQSLAYLLEPKLRAALPWVRGVRRVG